MRTLTRRQQRGLLPATDASVCYPLAGVFMSTSEIIDRALALIFAAGPFWLRLSLFHGVQTSLVHDVRASEVTQFRAGSTA